MSTSHRTSVDPLRPILEDWLRDLPDGGRVSGDKAIAEAKHVENLVARFASRSSYPPPILPSSFTFSALELNLARSIYLAKLSKDEIDRLSSPKYLRRKLSGIWRVASDLVEVAERSSGGGIRIRRREDVAKVKIRVRHMVAPMDGLPTSDSIYRARTEPPWYRSDALLNHIASSLDKLYAEGTEAIAKGTWKYGRVLPLNLFAPDDRLTAEIGLLAALHRYNGEVARERFMKLIGRGPDRSAITTLEIRYDQHETDGVARILPFIETIRSAFPWSSPTVDVSKQIVSVRIDLGKVLIKIYWRRKESRLRYEVVFRKKHEFLLDLEARLLHDDPSVLAADLRRAVAPYFLVPVMLHDRVVRAPQMSEAAFVDVTRRFLRGDPGSATTRGPQARTLEARRSLLAELCDGPVRLKGRHDGLRRHVSWAGRVGLIVVARWGSRTSEAYAILRAACRDLQQSGTAREIVEGVWAEIEADRRGRKRQASRPVAFSRVPIVRPTIRPATLRRIVLALLERGPISLPEMERRLSRKATATISDLSEKLDRALQELVEADAVCRVGDRYALQEAGAIAA